VSADGHAGAPIAEYRPYVDTEHLEAFDRFVIAREEWRVERNRSMGLPEDSELVHALFGEAMVDAYLGQEALRRGGHLGFSDSAVRNEELEREGIVAEVLFADFQNSNEPPWGAAFPFPDTNAELRQAGARIFDRWLADFCSQLPGRRAGVAVVQPHDVDAAVRDIRWVRESGLASVMLPTGDLELPSYHDTRYDPIWAACSSVFRNFAWRSPNRAPTGSRRCSAGSTNNTRHRSNAASPICCPYPRASTGPAIATSVHPS
jgi:hypothetical protein